MAKKKTTEEFKQEVFNIVGSEYTVLGKYITCHIKILIRHNKCGHEYKVKPDNFLRKNLPNRCPKCANRGTSRKELALLTFIKSIYNGEIIHGDRSILEGKEIDVLLPDELLGFEFNGKYWHSRKFLPIGYHEDKTKRAALKGIKLIHVAEKRWDKMNGTIKSMITNLII